MQHNDYITAVQCYLRKYNVFRIYLKNASRDIAELEQELAQLPAAPVAHITGMPGGHSGENTSPQEQAFIKRQHTIEKIHKLHSNTVKLSRMMDRLDFAIDSLPGIDRQLIQERWIKENSWILVASDLGVSISYCHKANRRIIKTLAMMMFGPQSVPDDDFVFLSEKVQPNQ